MTLQEYVQELAQRWAMSVNPDLRIDLRDGYVDYGIATSDHGDIGISTHMDGITVYGLGGHTHFASATNDVDEIAGMESEVTALVNGLLDGSIFAFEEFTKEGFELGGGYGRMEGAEFCARRQHEGRSDHVIIRRFGEAEVRLPASALRDRAQ